MEEKKIKQIVIEVNTDENDLGSIYWNLNNWVSSKYIQSYRTLNKDEEIILWDEEELSINDTIIN